MQWVWKSRNQEENHLLNRVQSEILSNCCQKSSRQTSPLWLMTQKCAISTILLKYWLNSRCIHLQLFRCLGDNHFRQLPSKGCKPMSSGMLNSKRLTVGGKGLQCNERKQKAGGRVSRVEWWCDTLLKQATVPAPLTVRLWAHVALIAASTEPADCTHYLLLASKKPHAELYEIFIQCVHFSSLFPLFLPFPIPHLGPPLPF